MILYDQRHCPRSGLATNLSHMESICSIFKLPKPERRRRDLDPRIIEKKKKIRRHAFCHTHKKSLSVVQKRIIKWNGGGEGGRFPAPPLLINLGTACISGFPQGWCFNHPPPPATTCFHQCFQDSRVYWPFSYRKAFYFPVEQMWKKNLGEALCCLHSGSCFPGLLHKGNCFSPLTGLFWESLVRSMGQSLWVGEPPFICDFQGPKTITRV